MSNAGLPSPAALVPAVDAASARSEANDLVTSALRIGLNLRCGYTALTPDWGAGELISASGPERWSARPPLGLADPTFTEARTRRLCRLPHGRIGSHGGVESAVSIR